MDFSLSPEISLAGWQAEPEGAVSTREKYGLLYGLSRLCDESAESPKSLSYSRKTQETIEFGLSKYDGDFYWFLGGFEEFVRVFSKREQVEAYGAFVKMPKDQKGVFADLCRWSDYSVYVPIIRPLHTQVYIHYRSIKQPLESTRYPSLPISHSFWWIKYTT